MLSESPCILTTFYIYIFNCLRINPFRIVNIKIKLNMMMMIKHLKKLKFKQLIILYIFKINL